MKNKNFVLLAVLLILTSSIVVYSADAAGIPKKAISTVARFLESDLPTTTVFTDIANTFGAGQKQTFTSSSTTAGLNIASSGSDPSSLADGDVWLNGATLKYRGSGATKSLVTSAITSINSDATAAQTIQGTAGNTTVSTSSGTTTINTGTNVVVNNLANTYAAGKKQTFQADGTNAGMRFGGVTSDPSSLSAGDMWRITGNDTFKVRGTGASQTIRTTNGLAQFSTFAGPTAATVKTLGTSVMGGFGFQFTPQQTGRVLVEFTFECKVATKLDGCVAQPAYGTGTPPTNGDTLTGTTVGAKYTINGNSVAAGPAVAHISVLITGVTIGTQYWIDLQYGTSVSNVAVNLQNVQVAIIEV